MNRIEAEKIATTLIECGINTKKAISLTAEYHKVSVEVVRSIKKFVIKYGVECREMETQANMILNGWADKELLLNDKYDLPVLTEIQENILMAIFEMAHKTKGVNIGDQKSVATVGQIECYHKKPVNALFDKGMIHFVENVYGAGYCLTDKGVEYAKLLKRP